jgi:eukaryotic-like serine/threonine-protein kinase
LLEAKAASAIGNEHIIDILDFGALPDGSAYLIMEYLDGVPLTELIRAEVLPPTERVVGIALQLAEGLAAAHAAGIVHRDLKPDNIFLVRRKAEDFVKILDFGIAKMSEVGADRLTHTGTIVGTPHYMSPEQAAGLAVDQRADIYALGVILYELVSGQVPFDGSNFMAVLTKHLQALPPAFESRDPPVCVPHALEAIIFKCLAKQPEQRYPSMHELQRALLGFSREPGQAIPNVPVRITSQPCPPEPSGALRGSPGMTQVVSEAGAAQAPGPSGLRARWVWLAASVFSIAIALGWTLSGTTQTHVTESAAAAPTATPGAPMVLPAEAAPSEAAPSEAAPSEAAPSEAGAAERLHVAPEVFPAPVADLAQPAAPVRSSAELAPPTGSTRARRKPRSVTSAERPPTPPAKPPHGRQDLVDPWPER